MSTHAPRSFLFVPGNREAMLAKAADRGADAIVFDLEDSVPPAEKDAARRMVADAIAAWPDGSTARRYIRINAPRLGQVNLDVQVIGSCANVGVVVPKVDRAVELAAVRDAAGWREMIVNVETPRALLHVEELADSQGVSGIFLGGEDLSAALGMRRTPEGRELDTARWQVLLAARAVGIAAWDTICPEFRDLDVLARDCAAAS